MNIEQLRDFLCVAETLNLTLAADRRNTTQSNLSKRLRSLETYLGRILIDRRSRPVSLTPAGEDFVPKARQVLFEIDAFRGGSAPWSPSEGGISIVMPHSATVAVFPRFRERLSHGMSGIHFAPRIANHDTAARLLVRSDTDLAIVTRHPQVPIDEDFTVFQPADIATDRLVVVEPPEAGDAVLPLHVPHPLTYIGRMWEASRIPLPATDEVPHGMAAYIRAHCLAGRARGVLPESLVEADIAAGRLAVRHTNASMDYVISLFCAPRASRRARQVWALCADAMSNSPHMVWFLLAMLCRRQGRGCNEGSDRVDGQLRQHSTLRGTAWTSATPNNATSTGSPRSTTMPSPIRRRSGTRRRSTTPIA
ncbi:LysR family transcriptional regulator [Paracoccus sp. pheM1]|uniref:LysR family transcriptional regulator n=1 Tax=Paracoccus sp. pheM1 TaxID=2831675 RepID=UPI001BDB874C|nr:LysR family transcriptional regulator [Paracoccus sp. pheM1]